MARTRAKGTETPKQGKSKGTGGQGKAKQGKAKPSGPPAKPGRYTPPKPKSAKRSPLWVPAAMFTCLLTGLLVIVGNYLELLPGGQAQNSSLFIGLGLMIVGFGLSTQYR